MNFGDFVEGPLLWIVFLALLFGIAIRLGLFSYRIITTGKNKGLLLGDRVMMFARVLIPFHMAVRKRPVYAALRYVFHICLFVVPIWLSEHIVLWSESRFEWEWAGLPPAWADWMTLLLLVLTAYFLLRRIIFPQVRLDSSASDYAFILLTALPFVSGYFATHGTLDSVPFFGDNIMVIHILSGQAMILMAVFLFYRTDLNPAKCTGCASCELSCPTTTLESKEQANLRIFEYSHYQCICCGSCVGTCPEDAAHLRHEITPKRFFQVGSKREIRSVEMKSCERCGALYVPIPLFDKIDRTIKAESTLFCPNCRKINTGEIYHQVSPRHRKAKKKDSHGQISAHRVTPDLYLPV